tara:strand:+ start:1265 stop:3487 length:2223 start_codon:yes stop_codon:yes gene_type:complete
LIKQKIIATLGPSSFNKKIVKKMDESGADLFRVNLSHTNINEYEKIINMVSGWTKKPVCPDTEGAQLRTGNIDGKTSTISLFNDQRVELAGFDSYKNQKNQIPLYIDAPQDILIKGDLLKIDFDSVMIQITEIENTIVYGRVISGGIVGSNKGISCDRPLYLEPFSEKDNKMFKIAKKIKQNIFFLSFCSNPEEIKELKNKFDYEVKVIAKIESELGIKNLKNICIESDGILIDRGDLSRDIPIEKIPIAQNYIINTAKSFSTPVYVATNLMENMINNSKPTRAEVNDIMKTLESGSDALVLAAETAIGKYPVECIRIMSRIIREFNYYSDFDNKKIKENDIIDYLITLPSDRIIEPHGGSLIQQHVDKISETDLKDIKTLSVDEKTESDIIQISEGTYSPIDRFMDLEEIKSVLSKNLLPNGQVWTLPIMFQINRDQSKMLPNEGTIGIKGVKGNIFALLKIHKIEKLIGMKEIAKKWFGTSDLQHPGVCSFLNGGNYIVCGAPFLIKNKINTLLKEGYELNPRQTRDIFNYKGWHNIIGFHTRNIVHRGHEHVQKLALEETNADAIFISPVTGIKKKGDFTAKAILRCYEKLVQEGAYSPHEVLIGSFNTYSRYSGPREAIFTAICRKNFGCNYFIVGRDHTGVGDYYPKDASQIIFEKLDIGMKILKFDEMSYCKKRKKITSEFSKKYSEDSKLEISGTRVRELITSNGDIPNYVLHEAVLKELKFLMKNESIFEQG